MIYLKKCILVREIRELDRETKRKDSYNRGVFTSQAISRNNTINHGLLDLIPTIITCEWRPEYYILNISCVYIVIRKTRAKVITLLLMSINKI